MPDEPSVPEPAPTFRQQAESLQTVVLSQEAWVRQAEQADRVRRTAFGTEADQVAYPLVCTRLNLPPLRAALENVERLAELAELIGDAGVTQALQDALAAVRARAAA